LNELSDQALVGQVRRGDRDAFAQLVDRHRARIFAILYRTVGDREMAEDLTQETFVKAYERLDAFSPEIARFQSWLITIATRTAIDHHRRKRPSESLEHLAEEKGWDPPSDARTDAGLECEETSEQVHRYLQKLPERQRVAVTLKHIEGLPFAEIAGIMGCSVNSAKVHAHRGRLQLAKYLGHLREEALR
jgi:RNA polymerase sigma-70 factor, ECF subfamily